MQKYNIAFANKRTAKNEKSNTSTHTVKMCNETITKWAQQQHQLNTCLSRTKPCISLFLLHFYRSAHSFTRANTLTHVYMPIILIVFKWRISLWLHGNCYYEYNCCCCSLHSACHFHFCMRVRSKCTFVLLVSYLGSVLVIIEQRAYTVHVADVSESRAAGTYSFAFKALFALQS